jgi:hypothetical protein
MESDCVRAVYFRKQAENEFEVPGSGRKKFSLSNFLDCVPPNFLDSVPLDFHHRVPPDFQG